MKLRIEAASMLARMPIRRLIFLGVFLGWTLLSVVVPVPAPPPGDGGVGPD
ncbi:MAG: hypothetical protein ACE5OZ_18305 [Candidatus Heimdallarchaeota archaeon]